MHVYEALKRLESILWYSISKPIKSQFYDILKSIKTKSENIGLSNVYNYYQPSNLKSIRMEI